MRILGHPVQSIAGVFNPRSAKPGFTLIELLVVVGIIVLLLSLLLPALGRAKERAYTTQTQALISNMASDIEVYHQTFNAYPGPASAATTAGVNGATKRMSGAQNLLLGLSYAMVGVAPANNSLPVPDGSMFIESTLMNGPINYSVTKADGNYEHLGAFFEPGPRQLSKPLTEVTGPPLTKTWPATGVTVYPASAVNTFAAPVTVDAYRDGLPILYYRRSPGAEPNGSVGVVDTSPTPSPGAPYYLAENMEYTSAGSNAAPVTGQPSNGITSTSGIVINQFSANDGSGNFTTGGTLSQPTMAAQDFNTMVGAGPSSSSARGGFLLISAGADRVYGRPFKISTGAPTGPSDDVVNVGGN